MSAENYNKIRRILFCTANDPTKGFSVAYEWMEGTYRKQLDLLSYTGLMAELRFYERHGKEYSLTVAGDMGEHADFAGVFGSQPARFDVTTNIDFKSFRDYEPFMGTGPIYKIALLDQGSFEVIDVLDLAFPRCEFCGGHLLPAIVLLDQNFNSQGESQWTNDQLLIEVCAGCEEYIEKQRYTHFGLFSPREHSDAIVGYDDNDFLEESTKQHVFSAYKYFRRQHSDSLMAVGSHNYKITDAKGGGYWAISFNFVNAAVSSEMPTQINCSHKI